MVYLFFLSGEHLDLARTEVELLFGKTTSIASNLLLYEQEELDLSLALRLAYTKSIGKLLKTVRREEDLYDLALENSYKLSIETISGNSPTNKELADKLYTHQQKPIVDLHHPRHHYVFFWTKETIFATEEIYFNDDNPHKRRSHLKLHNHPTGMHPKLAKAMINLAGTDAFIDPFCGVGGLVIEGTLMGLDAQGSDINAELIAKAQENALSLGAKAIFKKQDALTLTTTTPAIITDLPYGKNSLVTEDVVTLYKKFLLLAQTVTDTLVIGIADTTNISSLLEGTFWKLEQEFSIYMHKSLTRKIILLKQ